MTPTKWDFRVVVVEVDDWAAVYLKDECVYQDHKIGIDALKDALPADVELGEINRFYAPELEKYAWTTGRLPWTRVEAHALVEGEVI